MRWAAQLANVDFTSQKPHCAAQVYQYTSTTSSKLNHEVVRLTFLAAVASLVAIHAEVTYINHDRVQPFPQPKPTDSEKAAVKYKPRLHVSYGCQPYPAVQADGAVSAGLRGTGPANGECTGSTLGSQVYARSDWYKDKWAIMYAWYLPKGQYDRYRRRHFWEVAVVWLDNPSPENSTMLGVSLNSVWRLKTYTPVEA
ncbi:hypothetical protein PF010_g22703 [Phytophthora fragariae]|uniref:Necrosis inducing protein NPP1 type n=1 Tax=Phytophthora fragariae TaxID=53985 RepID=A0A6A3IPA4_9STRA|nr:hypothetical protein PF011_g22049 [Phytophthora fragariae]KAE9079600.1 hypothetical protein PF010_g22703 [Phytophthora fragariae]